MLCCPVRVLQYVMLSKPHILINNLGTDKKPEILAALLNNGKCPKRGNQILKAQSVQSKLTSRTLISRTKNQLRSVLRKPNSTVPQLRPRRHAYNETIPHECSARNIPTTTRTRARLELGRVPSYLQHPNGTKSQNSLVGGARQFILVG